MGSSAFTDREMPALLCAGALERARSHSKRAAFGLTNPQGNHGEDVKEWYWYLDSTPTHSYAKALYKYPQAEFPYQQLIGENGRRTKHEREYEIEHTGVFNRTSISTFWWSSQSCAG
jgi:hypothetical protein